MRKRFLLALKSQGQIKIFVSKAAKSLLIVIFVLAVFLFAAPVLAQQLDPGLEPVAEYIALSTQDIRVTIANIIRVFLGLLGIIAVVIVLYGGYVYMTSAGEPEKIKKAKKILINAFIGLLIILTAFSITQFILGSLLDATGRGGFPQRPPYGGGGGALGGGIIQSHYPERNASGITRNTSIVVTFKETMDFTSIIFDANEDGIFGNCLGDGEMLDVNEDGIFDPDDGDISQCDLINRDSIKIRPRDDEAADDIAFVRATKTEDNRTYVFKPVNLLGSPDEFVVYNVELTGNILKIDGSFAFGAYENYNWNFEVSDQIDITPPTVDYVIPDYTNNTGQTVPRNMVIQINFSEAINPIAVQDVVDVDGGVVGSLAADSFDNITVYLDNDNYVAGEFFISNGYRTVEFITDSFCGKNTCGGDVYCLPGPEAGNDFQLINVLAKAASENLGVITFPYDGVVDMADNSLDGNYNGTADGPGASAYDLNDNTGTGDNVSWSFYTNDNIELEPPELVSYFPSSGEIGVDPSRRFEASFDRRVLSSTVRSGWEGYCGCLTDSQCGNLDCRVINGEGYCVEDDGRRYVCTNECGGQCTREKEYINLLQPPPDQMPAQYPAGGWAYWLKAAFDGRTALLYHGLLGENITFGMHVGNGVQDLLQNCYQPCAGPECSKVEVGDNVWEPEEFSPGNFIWKPDEEVFPTCDLSSIDYGAVGNFVLNYNDGGTWSSSDFNAFSSDMSISEFYSYANDEGVVMPAEPRTFISGFNGVFNTFMEDNRTMAFIYYDKNLSEYYLIVLNGAPEEAGGIGGSGAGEYYGTITNAPDNFYFAVTDDDGGPALPCDTQFPEGYQNLPWDRYNDCGDTLYIKHRWATEWADGYAIYLGDGSEDFSFNLNVVDFLPIGEGGLPLDPEWVFFMTQRRVILADSAEDFPASISINYLAE